MSDAWVIVIGELDADDATAIRLHHITMDDEPLIPVFANPDAARRALAGTPAADKALRIRLDLLRDTLADDAMLVFDDGTNPPVRLRKADLHLLQTDEN